MVTRESIANKLAFLQLVLSLTPKDKGGITNDYVRDSLKSGFECVNYDSELQFQLKAQQLNFITEKLIERTLSIFPPKIEIEKIGHEFNIFLKSNKEYFSYGIEYGWLEKYLDCTIVWNEKYPYHAKVGTNYHAGRIAVQEQNILRDAFHYYVLAESELDKLLKIGTYIKYSPDPNIDIKAYEDSNVLNLNTCSYARTAILSLYSFFETFVNSISYDHYLRNKHVLTEKNNELLLGKYNAKYISLEKKIEKSHQIIRNLDSPLIKCIDKNQIIEPFKTVLFEHKELRDASVHYSPIKESIWIRPTDWVDRMKKYALSILEASRVYWETCYGTEFPEYLDKLDFENLYRISVERLKKTEDTKNKYT